MCGFNLTACINAFSYNTLQLLTVLGVLLGTMGFIYLTSEFFPHRLLTTIVRIITMMLSTTSFWIVCILFFLKFSFFGVAGLAFVSVSALAAGMISTFHGIFVIPYSKPGPKPRGTRPLLLRTRLKRRLKNLLFRLFHLSVGCLSGFLCLFLYGLLVFVILFFVNEDFIVSAVDIPAWGAGLIFGFIFGTIAGAIWRAFIYYPWIRDHTQHRGVKVFLSHLLNFSTR